MKISTRGRYAIREMVDLAQHGDNNYTPLKEIAERQDISEKYLESITKVLVREGLLIGKRGKNGGYKLSRDPYAYTVWDVLSILEADDLAPEHVWSLSLKNAPGQINVLLSLCGRNGVILQKSIFHLLL